MFCLGNYIGLSLLYRIFLYYRRKADGRFVLLGAVAAGRLRSGAICRVREVAEAGERYSLLLAPDRLVLVRPRAERCHFLLLGPVRRVLSSHLGTMARPWAVRRIKCRVFGYRGLRLGILPTDSIARPCLGHAVSAPPS